MCNFGNLYAAHQAAQEANRKAAEAADTYTPPAEKCDLCGATNEPLHTIGSPLPYRVCVDTAACERRQKEKR